MRKFLFDNSMRRFYFLILLFLVTHTFVFSQGRKHNFLIGYDVGLFDTNVTSTKARLNIDSNSISVLPETRKMPFDETQGNISDENGNLLIVSNGCWIANATGDTMMNGCCLNPGLFTNDWCDNTTGIPFPHANIILPYPGDSTKYVLFHQTGDYNMQQAAPSKLYYTIIDMTLDGGLGGVTLKNQIAFQDTLSAGIAACKHANGRDWWIVALKDSSNIIYKVLLTPTGISSITTQTLNVPLSIYNVAQPTFSPDGSKFAYTYGHTGFSPFHDIRLFHFDRCSGIFSDTTYIPFNDLTDGIGLAFSSNSKYLYQCSFQKVYQVNTDTNNISGTVDTVAYNDGYYSPYPPFQTDFWTMYLAANGKIYISSGNGVIDMHYINYPDSADTACDVHQHALHLPCYSFRGNVNHPNYYLGCDTTGGCPCLITGIDEQAQHNFHFKIFPDPAINGSFSISYLLPPNKIGKLVLYDINGKIVFTYTLPQWTTFQSFSLPSLNSGLYNCVITSGFEWGSKKVAIMKE